MSFSDFVYASKRKQTRRERFLAEMDQVVPWAGLVGLIEPHYPKAGGGRKPYPLETMLRIHLLQNWFSLSDPAMEEALCEITPMRQFARLTLSAPIPEDTTIMKFRHLLEKRQLAARILQVINGYLQDKGLSLRQGTIVDATIVHAPSSTKSKDGKRDPEMHQTKKGNQYFFGMKAHIGADVESGLVHHVHGTAANVADVTQLTEVLHGKENAVYADAGYIGVEKREEHVGRDLIWQIAARRSIYTAFAQAQLDLQGQAPHRTRQGTDPGEGRTPASGHQAAVRLRENAVPWAGEEHSATDDLVRVAEPVDGSKTRDRYGRVARVGRQNGLKSPSWPCTRAPTIKGRMASLCFCVCPTRSPELLGGSQGSWLIPTEILIVGRFFRMSEAWLDEQYF